VEPRQEKNTANATHHRHDCAARQELDQFGEERPRCMLLVVSPRDGLGGDDHLRAEEVGGGGGGGTDSRVSSSAPAPADSLGHWAVDVRVHEQRQPVPVD
jgi:hypothetical protein